MPHRIEVMLKAHLRDALGEKTARRAREDLGLAVEAVRTVQVYLVDAAMGEKVAVAAAAGPFSDPVTQLYGVNRPLAQELPFPWEWLVEVGFRPGVTDNEGRTAREALELLLGRRLGPEEGVYTARQYCLHGKLSRQDVERLAQGLLANDLIQRTTVVSAAELAELWAARPNPLYQVPRVSGRTEVRVEEVDLGALSDEALVRLSRDRVLVLNLQEMQAIRDYFRRPDVLARRREVGLSGAATDVELEVLGQTWSEHCKHKIFNARITYRDEDGREEIVDGLFDTYIRRGTQEIRDRLGGDDWCLSVFKDNAGVIRLNDRYGVAFKVETHNSPSALDPYGGALTGIVGVNRDPFGTGMGARLVFNTDVFCFGPPDYRGELPKGLLHPKRIFEGVREGVEHGGNQSGIPTVNGSILFDERYLGKPLVFCGTGGVIPLEVCGRPGHEKRARPGDHIVMCGGRIGKDGIHGATFSSEELHEGSPATAVQIGDPITQKKMTDFLLRARDLCLYNSITDNGAGGLSSSVGEMAEETGGFELHLDRAPLKYPGLQPWEILLSEAQERMTVAVPPDRLEAFMALAAKMGVEATDLGVFTDSGVFHCLYEGRTVAYLDMDFVHHGVPRLELRAEWRPPRHEEPEIPEPADLGAELRAILGRWNVCSKEYVVRQYDHEVQGGSVVKPLAGAAHDGPSDAAVLRPDLDSFEGLVVAHGICPRYSDIDTYHMAACAVDEAVRNAVAVGGGLDLMAGLDNFCWCDPVQSEKTPDGHYKLAQLVRANRALYDVCTAYGVPCISGKDSMKNDAVIGGVKISIPPTLLFSVVARMADVRRAVTLDAKRPGDLVYVVGVTYPETGASEYAARHGFVGNAVPRVRTESARARYLALSEAIRRGLVASCHDCSDGGLGVALAETAFSGGLGMTVDLGAVPAEGVDRLDVLLFSESQSRFVVTVAPGARAEFEALAAEAGAALVGEVTEAPELRLDAGGRAVLREGIPELKAAWQRPMAW
ncbi:phosphoribosylformylglycinamidine synthase [Dissulfurirhabdus thermomarina]|uniref:Phosphoribosylformylglycinamidine synthase subunit PurL n=1 Tax=Dissulfurirhabdus thermomarina TaxID=1765737 RepID=A0A6N9TQC7_DISTH|nr:AIR synthase-related protein [Dissulfurirhabdus thermomarina]NDY43465.1 phosphoribosylformylglycinamidine synthase [Dissulfurirhabdus thermomarina]NMX23417.1 phosphoribosylformylglycinamidine synthase [Dissulfurirhabdus thermomarina]